MIRSIRSESVVPSPSAKSASGMTLFDRHGGRQFGNLAHGTRLCLHLAGDVLEAAGQIGDAFLHIGRGTPEFGDELLQCLTLRV